ncbi:MAG: RNA-binding protein [Candidatus Woesearchaeota archaeon]
MSKTSQKEHLEEALAQNIRTDGRELLEFREITIEKGVSSTAHGSARLVAGEAEIIAGVKVDVGTPYPDSPDEGSLMVSAEMLAMSSRQFEGGRPGMESIEPARVIDRTIRESKSIDTKKLCIKSGEKIWMVMVDISPIAYDGNMIDLGAMAALAALQDAKMPELDKDANPQLEKLSKNPIPMNHEPIAVTVFKYKDMLLVDPTEAEEKFYDARLTVGVLEDGTPCALQKGGAAPLSVDEIDEIIKIAQKQAKKLRGHFK